MTHVYQSLDKDSKISIFQKCQRYLVKNYPGSEFIISRHYLRSGHNKVLDMMLKLYKEFNGSIYQDDDCLIFYKIFDIKEGVDEIYKKYDKESDENGNTILIIFATFDNKKSNIPQIIATELSKEIQKISFSRNGKFRMYDLSKFSSKF